MTDGSELRARDIAQLTGMAIRTVRRWIAEKTIPSIKLGGTRFVAKADLDHLLSPSPDTTEELVDGAE